MFKGLEKVYKAQKAKSATASYPTGPTARQARFLQNFKQTNHKPDTNRSPEDWQKVRQPPAIHRPHRRAHTLPIPPTVGGHAKKHTMRIYTKKNLMERFVEIFIRIS